MAAGRHEYRNRESDLKTGLKRHYLSCSGERYDRDQRSRSGIGGKSDRVSVNSRAGETKLSDLGINGKTGILENGGSDVGSVAKRRKFSPILWDKEEKKEKEVSDSIKTIPVLNNSKVYPVKSRDRQDKEGSNSISKDSGVASVEKKVNSLTERRAVRKKSRVSPPAVKSRDVILERVSQESSVEVGCFRDVNSAGSIPKETQPMRYSSSAKEYLRDDDYEPGEIEEEEFVSRNISGSRWADVKLSPGEKEPTPEVGEFIREGSGAKSSVSDGDYSATDFVDIRNADLNNDGSANYSATDSDGENYKGKCQKKNINMLEGCRSVREFERLGRIGEGQYGVVFRARDKKTGEVVALKKVKMGREEGFPVTALREINILLSTDHPSIVEVKEVVMDDDLDSIFMVMEYMEHDLKSIMEMKRHPFSQSEVKCLMLQLLQGVEFLHDNWVLHRDLKTSNILMNNQGELKICDFGLSRLYGSPLKQYTQLVVTLWYRAPELLLGATQYSTAIDMWSLGCIMAELLSKKPLFDGKAEIDQLDKIFRILGFPSETSWPGFSKLPGAKIKPSKHHQFTLRTKFPRTSFTGSPVLSEAGFDLLKRLLEYDPAKRITAKEAVNHEWFREVPLPMSRALMPTFPAQHGRRVMKSPDPLEEQRIRELQQKTMGSRGVFGSEL